MRVKRSWLTTVSFRVLAFSVLSVMVASTTLLTACGGEEAPRPPPAGRQPLPSSDPPRAAPSGGGRSTPMFAQVSTADRSKRLSGTARMREARAREEAARGPQRIGGERDRGQAIAQAMQAAAQAAPSDADACDRAWRAQQAMHGELGASRGASETEFLRACRAMPEADRNCMSPDYVRDHAEECERTQQETMERLQRQRHVARSPRDLP